MTKTKKLFTLTALLFAFSILMFLIELLIKTRFFSPSKLEGAVFSYLRDHFLSEDPPEYIEQPFLGFSNNPTIDNVTATKRINNLGLVRDNSTKVKSQESTYRILFLGGPSTFGMVSRGNETYPAIIENFLNPLVDSLTKGKKKNVECLNAGLRGATSADILTHYIFKYQYLDPDLIIIHGGFNDAYTYLCRTHGIEYQPDYHTSKRVFRNIDKPSWYVLPFLYSRTLCYIYIKLKLSDFLNSKPQYNQFYRYENFNLWFDYGNDSIFSKRYNALYNNYSNLVTIAKSKKQTIMLVPEIYYEYDKTFGSGNEKSFIEGMKKNTTFFRAIAAENMVSICELNASSFNREMYPSGEDRYLNTVGEVHKAKQILPCIVEILSASKKNN